MIFISEADAQVGQHGKRRVENCSPDSIGVHLERARALLTLGRTGEAAELAEACAEQMLEPSPIDAGRALAVLAEARHQLGDAELAIEVYEQAAELLLANDRYRLEVHSKLAALLREQGRAEEALDVLTRAVEHTTAQRSHS